MIWGKISTWLSRPPSDWDYAATRQCSRFRGEADADRIPCRSAASRLPCTFEVLTAKKCISNKLAVQTSPSHSDFSLITFFARKDPMPDPGNASTSPAKRFCAVIKIHLRTNKSQVDHGSRWIAAFPSSLDDCLILRV